MPRMEKVHIGELFKAVIALIQSGHSAAISDSKELQGLTLNRDISRRSSQYPVSLVALSTLTG